MMIRILLFLFIILYSCETGMTASPVVFFSDLTDGAITGWNASATQGAAVSIWGLNFGSSRGTSTVTVCGQTLNQDAQFAEWGATTNPTTARGLQRITFWLNSSMNTGAGTIAVTTSSGTSLTIPFYCRALGGNHIYFASRSDGNDSYDGLADHFVAGTNGPWKTVQKIRPTLTAGDSIYFRGNGIPIWNENDGNTSVFDFWNGNPHNNGTVNSSISLSSYPREVAQIADITVDGFQVLSPDSVLTTLNYWTISKFNFVAYSCAVCWGSNNSNIADDNFRIIGNDMTTLGPSVGVSGSVVVKSGGIGSGIGSTNFFLLGNYLHDAAQSFPRQVYNLYIEGYGLQTHYDIGWNEIYHASAGRGAQIYCHTTSDRIDDIKVHDNWIHNNALTGMTFGGGDGGTGNGTPPSIIYPCIGYGYIFNNIINNNGTGNNYPDLFVCTSDPNRCPWGFMTSGKNVYIYNNTFYHGDQTEVTLGNDGTTNYGLTIFKNNIFDNTKAYFLYTAGTPTDCSTTCAGSGYNDYYEFGNGPSWDTHRLDNTNPVFVSTTPSALTNFQLSTASTLVGSGTTVSYAVTDIFGTSRPNPPSIGASEVIPSTPDIYDYFIIGKK